MGLSVIDPVSPAIERTKCILFRPFDIGKWLRLGFCAFLMGLTSGGSGGGGGGGGGPSNDATFEDSDPAPVFEWIIENLVLILVVSSIVITLIILICFLLTWLSSRGHFMFLDGVVRNRGAVVEPWREFRGEGNSLFWFRIWLAFLSLGMFSLFLGFSAVLAVPDILTNQFGMHAISAIAFATISLMIFCIFLGATSMMLADFVVPIMYMRRSGVLDAWQVWYRGMLSGNLGTFILYFLFKIVMFMCVAVLSLMVVCGTCCIAIIPYVGTVILLPLLVFVRCYSLYFIEQFGPAWAIFPSDEESLALDP